MSKRADIIDGSAVTTATKFGLIYTCKAGWIDLGHANPVSSHPTQGAANLWKAIDTETGPVSPNGLWFKVTFEETQSAKIPVWGRVTAGVTREFAVKLGLSQTDKKSVALTIFMSVSLEFEKFQGTGWRSLPGGSSDSSFSAEDLVSNLLGFYRAVQPGPDYIKMCGPVSKTDAETVWDTYGSVGSNKVRSFKPMFFPCPSCPGAPSKPTLGTLPTFLDTIKPSTDILKVRPWDDTDPALTTAPSAPAAPAAPATPAGKTIPIKPGDSLSGIAKSEYGAFELWPLVWDQNPSVAIGGNPNKIKPGGAIKLAPLSSFTPTQIADAKRRAPTWKNYPH